jgi:hypothetical protein
MLSRIRRLPSPALVVAVVALVAAVGGGTMAIASSGKKLVNKQITKRAPGLSVRHATSADTAANADELGGAAPGSYERRPQRALVNGNGTIAAQSGGITVNSTLGSSGLYFVAFPTSVANRPVSVSIHYPDGGLTGQISATPCGGNSVPGGFDCTNTTGVNDPNHLLVRTTNSSGGDAAFGFYVTVGN